METQRRELFSQSVAAGQRTYFFDVKRADSGKPYLVISESRKAEEGYEHFRVLVFREHLEQFMLCCEQAFEFIKKKP